jgi:NAD(P)H-hydrate epimerase
MVDKQIPYLTAEQMIEVDRLMVEEYGVQLIQMMENAGHHLAELARRRFLGGDPVGKRVIVLAGSGGNGGGAMVSARNLANWGAIPRVILTKPLIKLGGTIKTQAEILTKIGVGVGSDTTFDKVTQLDLIVDGIIGYSLKGAPRGVAAEMITWANKHKAPILALDIPSGVNATTGEVYTPAIQASATLTLALPKTGLRIAPKELIGDLYLADISVPPELYSHPPLNLQIGNLFEEEAILPLF